MGDFNKEKFFSDLEKAGWFFSDKSAEKHGRVIFTKSISHKHVAGVYQLKISWMSKAAGAEFVSGELYAPAPGSMKITGWTNPDSVLLGADRAASVHLGKEFNRKYKSQIDKHNKVQQPKVSKYPESIKDGPNIVTIEGNPLVYIALLDKLDRYIVEKAVRLWWNGAGKDSNIQSLYDLAQDTDFVEFVPDAMWLDICQDPFMFEYIPKKLLTDSFWAGYLKRNGFEHVHLNSVFEVLPEKYKTRQLSESAVGHSIFNIMYVPDKILRTFISANHLHSLKDEAQRRGLVGEDAKRVARFIEKYRGGTKLADAVHNKVPRPQVVDYTAQLHKLAKNPVQHQIVGHNIFFWGFTGKGAAKKAVVQVVPFDKAWNTVKPRELKLYYNSYGEHFKVTVNGQNYTLHVTKAHNGKAALVHYGRGWQ